MDLFDSKAAIATLSGLIAAASTLAAVFLTSRFNARLTQLNLDAQARRQSLELKIARLEELYVLFAKWETNLASVYLAHLRCYMNKLSYNQVMELTKTQNVLLPGENQRMAMILNIHFPILAREYEPVEAARKEIATFLDDPATTRLSSSNFVAAQEQFERACADFKQKVAAHGERYQ